MRVTQTKDTMARLIAGRRNEIARYHAQHENGKFVHMNGVDLTDNKDWYWRGSYTQFQNLSAQHDYKIHAISREDLSAMAYKPTTKEDL